jgi:starch-binding outer membrane protein, SusD/RagB family
MRKLLYLISAISLIGIATSCKKQFLDTTPLGSYSDAAVWVDPNLAAAFVNNCYQNAIGWPFAIARLSDYSDETSFTPDWGDFDFNKCVVTQDNITGFEQNWFSTDSYHYLWNQLYANVRACNLFFSKVGTVVFPDDPTKTRTIGEVYFIRALTYHYLVAMYGGVPLITKPYGLGQNYDIARNTYEECINYITGQLDTAAMDLPASYSADMRGHATQGAALALKARTLLYAASDLHNTTSYAPGFANPELLGYTTGSQASRWTAAKAAAKAVIDLNQFSLYHATPAPTDSIAQTFVNYFLSYGYETEDILLQYFTLKTGASWNDYNPAEYCGPNGYHNWGNNTPLGDMVDQYDMKDGSSFDWTKPAELANPYAKRDARFYASILYEGVPWRKRPVDVQGLDPWDKIQVGHVYSDLAGTNQLIPGVDTRQGPIENWNGGRTGYYLRKFVDPTLDPQYVKQDIPFRHIRYAEVLLNYAEACIEENTGSDLADATTYINMIRTRAGQPNLAGGLSQAALRTAVRHERRIELAFEDHRFWDVRRWLIGGDAYKPTHRVDVKYVTPAAGNYRKTDGTTWGAPIYSNQLLVEETRAWLDKCYFMPIYRDEMNKNSKLIENPGY